MVDPTYMHAAATVQKVFVDPFVFLLAVRPTQEQQDRGLHLKQLFTLKWPRRHDVVHPR